MNAELFWSLLIKSSIIVILATLASLAARRGSASRRHLLWLAAVVCLLLLPMAGFRLPSWNVSADKTPMVRPFVAPEPLRVAVRAARPEAAVPASFVEPAPQMGATSLDPAAIVSGIWLAGIFLVLALATFSLLRVAMLIRSGVPWRGNTQTCSELGVRPRVLRCRGLQVPATVGVIRPVILLPEDSLEWDDARLRIALAHEAAHIQRHDWLWQEVARLMCALYWFNPLAWFAARQMRGQSEHACDDMVLGLGIEPIRYAQELLDFAKRARYPARSAVAMARSKNVENRLIAIVDGSRRRQRLSGKALWIAVAASVVLITPIAVLRAIPGRFGSGTHVHLPLIHRGASQEISPGVFLAKDGVATLRNGFAVRLVGLGTVDDKWDVNGQPLKDGDLWRQGGVYFQGNQFHRWTHGFSPRFGAFPRWLIVEVQSDHDAATATTCALTTPAPLTKLQALNPSYCGTDDRLSEVDFKANDPSAAFLELAVASPSQTGTFRFGVAGPDWRTDGVLQNPFFGAPGGVATEQDGREECAIMLDAQPGIWYQDSSGENHRQDLLPSSKADKSRALRAFLYDSDGQLIHPTAMSLYDDQGYEMIRMDAETFGQIKKIVVQSSPYRWAEFRDVPLKPKIEADDAKRLADEVKRQDPGIRGTATGIAPGFSKTLRSGVTVSVASVTKAIADGSQWTFVSQPSWRADGEVLRDGPQGDVGFKVPVQTWGKPVPIHIDIAYDGRPADANTWVSALNPDPGFRQDGPGDWAGTASLTAAFPRDAKTASIRVGVAAGPWQTVARRAIDIPEEPANTTGDAGRTGLELMSGSSPKMAMADDSKIEELVSTPLTGVASRFVAVLRSGKTQVLRSSGHASASIGIYALPARHGERTEGVNNLIAADIKEIQVQTRPFEFVDFNGIALSHR